MAETISTPPRVASLDGWRGFAILLVTIGHFAPFPTGRLADTGVELFFVLSGRLMAELLIVRAQPLPGFFLRRAARIVPAYAVYVALCTVAVAIPALVGAKSFPANGVLAAAGFVTNYQPQAAVVGIFEHTWSLAVEEHGYVLLAAIALIVARRSRLATVAALVLAGAAMLNGLRLVPLDSPDGPYAYWRTDVRVASILLGFAFHLALLRLDPAWLKRLALAVPVLFAAGMALHTAILPEAIQCTLGSVLLALAVNLVEHSAAPLRRLFELRALALLGLISFSFYLWQQPFMLVARLGGWPVMLALSIGCGIVSYRYVERPLRRRLNARWGQSPAHQTGALAST